MRRVDGAGLPLGRCCQTKEGIELRSIIEGGEVVQHLKDRILGRVLAEPLSSKDGSFKIPKGTLIDEPLAEQIEKNNIDIAKVRSPITCETSFGICSKCYGRDLAKGRMVSKGEAVGVVAAQSIGEPGTQLTMRTFHVGGTAQIKQESEIVSKNEGTLKIINTNLLEDSKKNLVVMGRNTQL